MSAGKLAREKFRDLATATPERETVTKLSSDTMRIVRRWQKGSVKETVALLAIVADEALTAAKAEEEAEHGQGAPRDRKA